MLLFIEGLTILVMCRTVHCHTCRHAANPTWNSLFYAVAHSFNHHTAQLVNGQLLVTVGFNGATAAVDVVVPPRCDQGQAFVTRQTTVLGPRLYHGISMFFVVTGVQQGQGGGVRVM